MLASAAVGWRGTHVFYKLLSGGERRSGVQGEGEGERTAFQSSSGFPSAPVSLQREPLVVCVLNG